MKIFLATLSLVFTITGLLFLDVPAGVHAAGYMTRSFTVTNSLGSVQNNYPIEQVINTAAEISAGRMRSDCGDIRVYDTDFATAFTYAVIDCNTTYTSLVYIDPVLTTGAQTHYITYGDAGLISAANPSAVFDIWDLNNTTTTPDCSLAGNAVWDNTNKWARLTINSGALVGTCNYSYLSSLGSRGYKAFFDTWAGGTAGGADAIWQYAFNSGIPNEEDGTLGGGAHFTADEYQDRYCYTRSTVSNGTCDASFTTTTLDNSTWRNLKVTWDTGRRTLWENGVRRITTTAGTAPTISNVNFGLGARTGGISNEHRVRNFAVIRHSESVTVSALGAISRPQDNLAFALRTAADTGNFALVCDYGDVTTSTVASCSYRIKVTSNARNGYTVNVVTSGGITSGSDTINNALSGGSGGTAITAGSEAYGVVLASGSCTHGTITIASPFNAGSNAVRFDYTSAQSVYSCSGPNLPLATDTTNTALINHRLAISGSTPAGVYTQSIVWTVSPNY